MSISVNKSKMFRFRKEVLKCLNLEINSEMFQLEINFKMSQFLKLLKSLLRKETLKCLNFVNKL
jgi:hypothetical protein